MKTTIDEIDLLMRLLFAAGVRLRIDANESGVWIESTGEDGFQVFEAPTLLGALRFCATAYGVAA